MHSLPAELDDVVRTFLASRAGDPKDPPSYKELASTDEMEFVRRAKADKERGTTASQERALQAVRESVKRPRDDEKQSSKIKKQKAECFHCHRQGHLVRDCDVYQAKVNRR